MAERSNQPYIIVRIATLDENPGVTPKAHIWTSQNVPWIAYKNIPAYPGNGNREDDPHPTLDQPAMNPSPALLSAANSLLIIVDIQAKLLDAMPETEAKPMTENTGRLLEATARHYHNQLRIRFIRMA